MARPRKFKNEHELLAARNTSRELVKEVLEISGLSIPELSDRLGLRVGINEEMLRQYSAGRKPMSDTRVKVFTTEALRLNFGGERCRDALLWASIPNKGKLNYSQNKESAHPLATMTQSLDSLFSLGWTKAEILYMVIDGINNLAAKNERSESFSGILSPAMLPIEDNEDLSTIWLHVMLLPWATAGEEDFSSLLELLERYDCYTQ